jgi:hypothetical protein
MSQPNENLRKRATRRPHRLVCGSEEATRMAVVVLEVLGGSRTPNDAAAAMGVSPPRYYQLETRALEGLVAALETKPKGRGPSPEGRITQLEKELTEARRECLRQQALVRAAQRSLGIKPAAPVEGKPAGKDAAGRRKRRPSVRALKAARALAAGAAAIEADSLQQEEPAPLGSETAPSSTSSTVSEGVHA